MEVHRAEAPGGRNGTDHSPHLGPVVEMRQAEQAEAPAVCPLRALTSGEVPELQAAVEGRLSVLWHEVEVLEETVVPHLPLCCRQGLALVHVLEVHPCVSH